MSLDMIGLNAAIIISNLNPAALHPQSCSLMQRVTESFSELSGRRRNCVNICSFLFLRGLVFMFHRISCRVVYWQRPCNTRYTAFLCGSLNSYWAVYVLIRSSGRIHGKQTWTQVLFLWLAALVMLAFPSVISLDHSRSLFLWFVATLRCRSGRDHRNKRTFFPIHLMQ